MDTIEYPHNQALANVAQPAPSSVSYSNAQIRVAGAELAPLQLARWNAARASARAATICVMQFYQVAEATMQRAFLVLTVLLVFGTAAVPAHGQAAALPDIPQQTSGLVYLAR